jgi:hypothetical protein
MMIVTTRGGKLVGEAYGTASHSVDFRIYRRFGEPLWHLECEFWDFQYWRLDVEPQKDWRDLVPEMERRQAALTRPAD